MGAASGAAAGAAAGSLAGPIGTVAGAVIGGVGSYLTGKSSARAAERNYKHRYQWQVKDMMKAGINPMLAFSQAPPNVPQPHFPDIGEGATRGAQAGSAAMVARAQISNIAADSASKLASAKASEAMAEKTTAEKDVIVQYGSAEAAGRVKKLEQDVAESITRAAELMSRVDLNQQEFFHKEQHNPIIRRLDTALAAAKEAEIPLKDLIASVAESISGSLQNLSKVDGEALLKDTGNLIEDKLGNGAKLMWNLATGPYRFINGSWQKFKEYARDTRQEAVR